MSLLGIATALASGWEDQIHRLGVANNNTPHCGLQNEGATCYLNSYLQALFHLPRFRREVYAIDTNGDGLDNPSVPLALQCIFYELQTRKGSSVSTRVLTRSFERAENWKWSSHERFMQHDAHEFSRKFLDELEPKMVGLKEMLCGKEKTVFSWGEDQTKSMDQEFYDMLLNVKGCDSLEFALEQFCQPESLQGDNQYDTGTEEGRKDALKSTFFDVLPPVLSINLKRFEPDEKKFGTYKKVNDSQTFPETLVLPKSCLTSNVATATYKLYAVLSHSGTVSGGHYFAFMRPDLDSQTWYKFDDQSVSLVSQEEAMDNNFGGNGGTANAYMLIYIAETDAREYFSSCDIPEAISDKFSSSGSTWGVEQAKYHVKINFGGVSTETTVVECSGVDDLMNITEELKNTHRSSNLLELPYFATSLGASYVFIAY